MDFFIRVASITKHQFFREIMFDLGIIDQIRRSKNRSSWILNMTTDEVGGEKHSRKPCCEILRCWSCLPSTTSSSTLRSLSGVISAISLVMSSVRYWEWCCGWWWRWWRWWRWWWWCAPQEWSPPPRWSWAESAFQSSVNFSCHHCWPVVCLKGELKSKLWLFRPTLVKREKNRDYVWLCSKRGLYEFLQRGGTYFPVQKFKFKILKFEI